MVQFQYIYMVQFHQRVISYESLGPILTHIIVFFWGGIIIYSFECSNSNIYLGEIKTH